MPTNPNDDETPDNTRENVADEVLTPDDLESDAVIESVSSDQWVQAHQVHYDRERGEELSTVLTYTIAEAQGVDPLDYTQMPPLYETIDAQALEETFFGPYGANTPREQTGVVTFKYNGYKVALRADGWIFVYEPR